MLTRRGRRGRHRPPPPPPPRIEKGSADGMFRVHIVSVYARCFVLRFAGADSRHGGFLCVLRDAPVATDYRAFVASAATMWVEDPSWEMRDGVVTKLVATLYATHDMLCSINEHMAAAARAEAAAATASSSSSLRRCCVYCCVVQ